MELGYSGPADGGDADVMMTGTMLTMMMLPTRTMRMIRAMMVPIKIAVAKLMAVRMMRNSPMMITRMAQIPTLIPDVQQGSFLVPARHPFLPSSKHTTTSLPRIRVPLLHTY